MATQHEASSLECPFCGHQAPEYGMLLHMEQQHAEGDSPFIAKETPRSQSPTGPGGDESGQDGSDYAECPIDGCGEVVLASEMAYHIDLHAQEEDLDNVGPEGPTSGSPVTEIIGGVSLSHSSQYRPRQQRPQPDDSNPRRHQQRHPRQGENRDGGTRQRHRSEESKRRGHSSARRSAIQAWRELLNMPSVLSSSTSRRRSPSRDGRSGGKTSTATAEGLKTDPTPAPSSAQPPKQRLGKAELGKYAHEQAMPAWLVAHLRDGGEIKTEGILPVLEQLLEQSPSTKYAFLCHPSVQHISKLKREGGFCGYRNIQMLVSYINAAQSIGAHHFKNKLPSVFEIQDMIEDAWDRGINAQGRIETGGVRGTRKYIGTPEAQAVFCSLEIPCEAQGFKNREPGKSEARLLQEVERYFQSADFDPQFKVRRTSLPPIYFQHAGHSMTIVGIEKSQSGGTNLLVFDPMFRDSSAIVKLVGREFEHRFPDLALKSYRRGNKYLKKYREFELLRLRPPPGTQAAN